MAAPALALDPDERWPEREREQLSLVVQTSFLGDVVLTTPLLAELSRRGPVDVVVRPDAAPLLACNPAVRRVIVYDKRGADAGVRGLWRLARQIRLVRPGEAPPGWRPRERVAYLAQGSVRSAMLARLAGCGERVGFETSRQARPLYTRVVRYRADRHHAERLWSLAMPDEARPTREQLRPHLYPGRDERHAVDALLAAADTASDAAPGDPLVALAPGSVWATKRWPYYPELAARLAEHARLVVIGSGADRELGGSTPRGSCRSSAPRSSSAALRCS
jgi:heptosyltransferase II